MKVLEPSKKHMTEKNEHKAGLFVQRITRSQGIINEQNENSF